MPEAKPYPKSAQLARGERRYRRKVASPKQWQAIIAAKRGPCRACGWEFQVPGGVHGGPQYHHIVSREDHGDDVEDNIAPLCQPCHDDVTRRDRHVGRALLASLSDAEYAYMIERGGPDYAERAYGVTYSRESQR